MEISTCHREWRKECKKNYYYTKLGGVRETGCPRERYHPKFSVCWTCRERFSSRGALFRHLKSHQDHMIEPPNICYGCLKSFMVYSTYLGEIKTCYSGDLKVRIHDHLTFCILKRPYFWNDTVLQYHLKDDKTTEKEKELIRRGLIQRDGSFE